MSSEPYDLDQLRELHSLQARTDQCAWFYRRPMTEEESGKPGGQPAGLVKAVHDHEEPDIVSVLDDLGQRDMEFMAAAKNISVYQIIQEIERLRRRENELEEHIAMLESHKHRGFK